MASDDRGRSPPRGGPSAFRDRPWCYVRCSNCHVVISDPFSRTSGPVLFVHRVRYCRRALIVTPAEHGEAHRVERIPDGVSLEQALEQALRNVA